MGNPLTQYTQLPHTGQENSHCAVNDFRMAAHSQVVIAAPNCNGPGVTMVVVAVINYIGYWEGRCVPLDHPKLSIALRLLFRLDLVLKEVLVVKHFGTTWEKWIH